MGGRQRISVARLARKLSAPAAMLSLFPYRLGKSVLVEDGNETRAAQERQADARG